MPALYRMPVFYLALAVVASTFALATRGRLAAVPGSGFTPGESSQPSASHAETTIDAGPDSPDADGIQRTDDGLRRKVLVKSLDLTPARAPGGSRNLSHSLDYFSIHFVFDQVEQGGVRRLQVGPSGGPPVGWVDADAVLEWDTRLMARLTPDSDRPRLRIYRDRTCLLASLESSACPEHPEICPTEGEESTAETDSSAKPTTAGLPILTIRPADGDGLPGVTTFEVASLVQDRAPAMQPDRPPADLVPYLERVYVAFAIDSTASMRASIEAARELAEQLVADATRRHARVALRLGLVEYRDDAPAIYGFKTRILTHFTDPASFRRALDRLEPAAGGDGTVDEQVLDGLAAALPRPPGEPVGAVQHLDWPSGRSGELATKLLILLGDAPDHDRDLSRAGDLAARAREAGISIAAIAIDRPDRSRDEEARYREQWRVIAEGSYRPLDPSRGFDGPIDPLLPTLGGDTPIVPVLQVLIDDRIERAKALAALAQAEAESRLEAYVTSQGLTLDQVHPVLVDLHRGEPRPEPRPDPRFGGRKAPSVRRGWIAEEVQGRRLVEVEVLMSRDELDALIDEISTVLQAVEQGVGDVGELIRIGTAAAAGESAFLAEDRGSLTLAEHLSRRRGLPPPSPDSLLQQTQADLLQADGPTRAALVERLARDLEALIERRRDPDWNDPTRTLDGMATVPYSWIDF